MATTTITTTLTLHLPAPEGKIHYQTAADSLKKVDEKYSSQDPLSKQLKIWIHRIVNSNVMNVVAQQPDQLDEIEVQFRTLLSQRVNELFSTILVSPLDRTTPLGDHPILDGEWAWSRSGLDKYYQLTGSNLSPYTGQPIVEMPHTYAAEVTKVVRAWITNSASSSGSQIVNAVQIATEEFNQLALAGPSSQALVSPAETQQLQQFQEFMRTSFIMNYIHMADQAKTIAKLQAETLHHSQEMIIMQNLVMQLEEEHNQLNIASERNLREHERLLQATADSTNGAHQAELTAVHDELAVINADRTALEKRIDAADKTIEAYSARMLQQDIQIASLQGQVNALANRKRKKALIPIYF